MHTELQFKKSLYNLSKTICHINDAEKKSFHVYFATQHYKNNIRHTFIQLRSLARKTNQEIPGILECRDFAGSRSSRTITNDEPHFHALFFFVDHPNVHLLIDKSKELLIGDFREYVPKKSILRTVAYTIKVDGWEYLKSSIVNAHSYPLDFRSTAQIPEYMKSNIEKYIHILPNDDFIGNRYLEAFTISEAQ